MHKKAALIIVAHPDDETLWSGGTILNNPSIKWFIISLCRGKDAERAQKFFKALKILEANGIMGDIDDEPEQRPISELDIETAILDLLAVKHFDLIISHSPKGEYTRHIRHEEVGSAVINLWHNNQIATKEYWAFAYEDGNKQYLPRPHKSANIQTILAQNIWQKKYEIMTKTYGFELNSWEARSTPRTEAFWQFYKSSDAIKWVEIMRNEK